MSAPPAVPPVPPVPAVPPVPPVPVGTSDAIAAFAGLVGNSGPVAVAGCRTRWEVGGLPEEGTRLVQAPAGVIDYRPEEMTVRVLCGTTVAELHSALAERGQRTCLPERGSVGGALAVGHDDLLSAGRGKVQDAVLELRYVTSEGRVAKGGAPTVKNVSGFDVPRLMVGALGTLGLLAEVVLRTRPVPAAACWLRSDDADPFVVRDLVRSAAAVLWDGVSTFVELEGHGVDVEADSKRLGEAGSWQAVEGPPPLPGQRWSLKRSELRGLDPGRDGRFVASVATGLVLAERARPVVGPAPEVLRLAGRMKAEFDPAGRLNPGRDPMRAA